MDVQKAIISYLIMAGKKTDITPISIPENMHHEILRWLPGMPHSVLHYLSGSLYYENVINRGESAGLNVCWLFEGSYQEIISEKFKSIYSGLNIYVIAVSTDEEIENVNNALKLIPADGLSVIFTDNARIQAHIPIAKNRDQLLDIIDTYALVNFANQYSNKREVNKLKDSLDLGMLFNPTVSNTELQHSALGDFRFPIKYYSRLEKYFESQMAKKEANTFNRQITLINQLKIYELLDTEFFTTKDVAPWMAEQRKSPLIISIPYNTKEVSEFGSGTVDPQFIQIQKYFKACMKAGQTTNYTVSPNILNDEDGKAETNVSIILSPRSRYLDILGGLHASLRFSPILRLPAVGSSFNGLLSRVAPVASERLTLPHKKQSLIKTLNDIGRELSRCELSKEAEKYIQTSERQIVAITDLPIEWMNIDGIPLGFTHDVCRIPEVPYAIGMQHYVISKNFKASVPENIMKRTLVVFGCSDKSFLPYQQEVIKLSSQLGFKTIRPKNIDDFVKEIKDFNPYLIIIDTHGNYDRKTHESYLQIGNDNLYPNDVINKHISAPLIFLSACNTAPVYNLTKTIVNSMVAEGAHAVTASYMPLSIHEASVTYMRLLRLLDSASNKVIHKNWLSFISHVLRTSAVHESFLTDESLLYNKERHTLQVAMISNCMKFSERRNIFERIRKGMTIDGKRISFDKHVPNYLMYTTIGRADLINFEHTHTKLLEVIDD